MKVYKRTIINRTLKNIFAKHGKVLFAYLYGSYAKGDEGPLSDIDAARAHFESIAIGEWLDWQPYADFYTETAFQEVQEFFYGSKRNSSYI